MDHERVAALHDGRLGPRERDELLNELLANDDEYELFAETAAVLRELEEAHAANAPAGAAVNPADPAAPAALETAADEGVIPLASRRPPEPVAGTQSDPAIGPAEDERVIPLAPRKPGRTRWMAYGTLAAGLAGLALTATLLTNRGGPLDDPAEAVAMLDAPERGPALGWDTLWVAKRGLTAISDEDRLAVRLGANAVELELAAAARDSSVGQLSRTAAWLLKNSDILGSASTAARYDSINQLAQQGDSDIEPLLSEAREGLRGLLPTEWLELGVWAETARTAALRRDAGFFRSRDSRAALERIGTLPGIDEQLAAVRQLLPEDGRIDWPANDARWTTLADHLATLLREAAR